MQLYTRRRMTNVAVIALSLAATALGLLWLVLVLWTLLANGIGALGPALFTQMTPPPGSSGGLLNAIFGSLAMTAIATLVGTPTGILAGTFLAEYARGSRFGDAVRFINDILLSAPSIIIGLFVYTAVVVPMGHFSGWAGAAALAIIMIPVVVRTTEDMLRLVPDSLRFGAAVSPSRPASQPIDQPIPSAAGAPAAKVDIRRVNFFYGKFQALHDITVPLYDRSVTAFIGPSGCGKSTLLRILNRIYELYPGQTATGEVIVDGEDILTPGIDLI